MTHTKEPWHLCEVENETGRIKHLVPVDSEKMSLLTIVENDQGRFAAIYNDEDARRIVACVNFCRGVPDSELKYLEPSFENMAVVHWSFPIRLENAERQRDELLAALEVAESILDSETDYVEFKTARDQIRAAIASVKPTVVAVTESEGGEA